MNSNRIPQVEHFEWFLKRQEMKVMLGEWFELNGIVLKEVEIDRIISTPAIRNIFILRIYNIERSHGVKAEYLYCKLGEVFGLGFETVKEIVHKLDVSQKVCQRV